MKNKKKTKDLLSIIAPVKDEKDNIEWTVKNIRKIVKPNYEILIIYDSKDDSTLPVVKKLMKKDKRIFLKRNKKGRGVLNAIKTGFEEAKGNILVMMAVDRTDDPKTINTMHKKIIEGYDMVCPTRYSIGGKVEGKISIKSLLSRISGISTPVLLGIPTSDLTYSYKMFKKEILEDIKIESKGGFEFAEELLIKAHFAGYKITQVPTYWVDRKYGKSKFLLKAWLPRYLYWYFWGIRKRINNIFKNNFLGFLLFTFYSLELLLIILFFRNIRDIYSDPMVGESKTIAYTQYFGYPIYLDSFLFFGFLILPPLVIIFAKRTGVLK
jgi:dolichol-phosphate mannosyltransferase